MKGHLINFAVTVAAVVVGGWISAKWTKAA